MMDQNNLKPGNLLQHITQVMPQFCDKCGSKHLKEDLEIMFSSSSKAVCKLNCKSCGNSYMIHVNSPAEGMLSAKRAEYRSEISGKEFNKFSNSTSIQSDEILDVFDALKSVQTIEDFNKLAK